MIFVLTRWDGEELVSEIPLEGMTASEVQKAFEMHPDAYPGDCLLVEEPQVPWLEERGLEIDVDRYSYFVEAQASYPGEKWSPLI